MVLAEEEAKSPGEAEDFYERGVRTAQAHLGEEAFRKDAGRFWQVLPTRPYMRARAGLARCLWYLGERNEAISHFKEMLRFSGRHRRYLNRIIREVVDFYGRNLLGLAVFGSYARRENRLNSKELEGHLRALRLTGLRRLGWGSRPKTIVL